MPSWRHTLAVAQRRSAAKAALTAATAVLPFAAGAALAWVAVASALDQTINWPVIAGGVAACAAACALVGFFRRPSPLTVASTLDRHAGNYDAIASALQLSAKPTPTPLEARAIADADTAAASPAGAFPWSLRRPVLLTTFAAVMLTGAAFIPARWSAKVVQLAGLNPGPPKVEVQKALADTKAAEQLINAVQPPTATPQPGLAAANSHRPDALSELREQLEKGTVSPKEATQQAATAVERAADRLDERAADAQAAHDLLRDRLTMGQQDHANKPTPEQSSALSRALRDGDIDKAAAEAERLVSAVDKLSDADRARLADDLKKLADDLKQPPTPTPTPVPSPSATQPTEPKSQAPKPVATTKPPQPENPDKPTPQSESAKETRDLADKLDKAADELSKPQPAGKPNQPTKPEQPQPDKANPIPSQQSQTQQDSTKQSPDGTPPPNQPEPSKPNPDGKPQPERVGEAGGDKPPSGEKPAPDGKPQTSNKPRQGDTPQADGKPETGDTHSPTAKPQTGDNPQADGKPQPASQPQADKNGQPQPEAKPSPDGKPQPGPEPSDKAAPLDQLRDTLKKIADQPRNAQQDKQDAQKLREQAQKMWDNASPQQRKEMEKLARELAQKHNRERNPGKPSDHGEPQGAAGRTGDKDDQAKGSAAADQPSDSASKGGGPGDQPAADRPPASGVNRPTTTQDIDARSKGETQAPSRVIAEWLTNKPSPREGTPTQAPADVTQAVRQSQQNAEQAVQERTVPSRLSPLIRRYFERLPQAVGTQPPTPPPSPATPSLPPAPTPVPPAPAKP